MTATLNTAMRIAGRIMSTPAGNTLILITWSALMMAAAYWLRFDAPIWGGLF